MALYYSPTSTHSQRALLCLSEQRKTNWTGIRLDLAKQEHLSERFLKVHPEGLVPALVFNGTLITDSWVICEFLCEIDDSIQLMPKDPTARALVRAWARMLDERATVAIRELTLDRRLMRLGKTGAKASLESLRERHPTRQSFFNSIGPGGLTDQRRRRAEQAITELLVRIDHRLSDSGRWLFNDAFTLAEIATLPILNRALELKLPLPTRRLSAISAWLDHLLERPSTTETFPLLSEFREVFHQ